MSPLLDQVSKGARKDLVKTAVDLYKSGAEPSPPEPTRTHLTRAERRQAARALGWRGSKAKRQNFQKRIPQVLNAVLADEALTAAKERVEHPLRSRLRRS